MSFTSLMVNISFMHFGEPHSEPPPDGEGEAWKISMRRWLSLCPTFTYCRPHMIDGNGMYSIDPLTEACSQYAIAWLKTQCALSRPFVFRCSSTDGTNPPFVMLAMSRDGRDCVLSLFKEPL